MSALKDQEPHFLQQKDGQSKTPPALRLGVALERS